MIAPPPVSPRIYLSSPHIGEYEQQLVTEAFASNWIAPLGPHVDAFEREVSDYVGMSGALALTSGTAAIHLALRYLGVERGDHGILFIIDLYRQHQPNFVSGC